MRANVPKMVDQDQFRDGGADIDIAYFQRNAETGALEEFTCGGAECSRECVPDVVSVRINNYQFTRLFSYFGLQPVTSPQFLHDVADGKRRVQPGLGVVSTLRKLCRSRF